MKSKGTVRNKGRTQKIKPMARIERILLHDRTVQTTI
jgi:hypothetical protein